MNRDNAERRKQQLITMGKAKGYLTYDEVSDHMPDEVVSADQIDDWLSTLGDEGIEVVDSTASVKVPSSTSATPKVPEILEEDEKKEEPEVEEPVAEIDWSKDMHPIEHQKGCASCYAFSTVAPLEFNHFKKTGQKIKLSKQELVDCSGNFGNTGCRGGWMHQSYDYILNRKGLSTETSYPYLASQMKTCTRKSQRVESLLSSYDQVPCDKPSAVIKHLKNTVIPSAIDVSGLMFYEKGIFTGNCPVSINHAVVIVGMGEENGVKYWKIRNSWGSQWGEKGYLRLQRETKDGVMGKCGITVYNVVPL